MNKLLALADRVEKLTGPDDDAFREAFDACFPKPERVWEDEDRERWSTEYENHHNLSWKFESFLEVGAYLDAAMMMVPEGYGCKVDTPCRNSTLVQITGPLPSAARVFDLRAGVDQVRAGETPALALICASLRARAHGGGEG